MGYIGGLLIIIVGGFLAAAIPLWLSAQATTIVLDLKDKVVKPTHRGKIPMFEWDDIKAERGEDS